MNSPWVRDVASSGFQWAYDNRNYLQKTADKMYLNKYRDYQEKTKRYKQIARGNRRLSAKRALDFGPSSLAKRAKYTIPYRGSELGTKKEWLHVEQGAIASKSLVSYLMTDIPLGAVQEDSYRNGSSIFVKGCKLRFGIRNLQGTPLMVNIALIAGKQSMEGITTVPTGNFFQNDGSVADQRYLDFDPATKSARQLHYLPINTERWTVLHHHRKIINTSGDGDLISSNANRGGGPADWYEHDKYVAINRRLTYDTNAGTSCTTPIWVCIWVSRWDQTIGAAVAANQASVWLYVTSYFKDQ